MAEAEEGEAAEEDPADAGGDRPAAEGALRCWFYCLYGWGCWMIKVFFTLFSALQISPVGF